MRVGQGYDVHAFGEGDQIVIGGVTIPYHRGLVAHSDGDVLIHALCTLQCQLEHKIVIPTKHAIMQVIVTQ